MFIHVFWILTTNFKLHAHTYLKVTQLRNNSNLAACRWNQTEVEEGEGQ